MCSELILQFCTQLTKAYVAETSCSQLLLIDSATCMLKTNSLVISNVAMSLYSIIDNMSYVCMGALFTTRLLLHVW